MFMVVRNAKRWRVRDGTVGHGHGIAHGNVQLGIHRGVRGCVCSCIQVPRRPHLGPTTTTGSHDDKQILYFQWWCAWCQVLNASGLGSIAEGCFLKDQWHWRFHMKCFVSERCKSKDFRSPPSHSKHARLIPMIVLIYTACRLIAWFAHMLVNMSVA